jgi:hypothetical protein
MDGSVRIISPDINRTLYKSLGILETPEDNRFLTYLEFAEDLVAYVKKQDLRTLFYAHGIYDPSWGYQLVVILHRPLVLGIHKNLWC